jgi:beta-galactosidase
VVPGAENLVSFAVAGPGAVAATDNADIANHESFQSPERHAFQGQCQAIVRAAAAQGSITVTASAAGLKPATVRIEVRR